MALDRHKIAQIALCVILTNLVAASVTAAPENWQSVISESLARAEMVVIGEVVSTQSLAATDGGNTLELNVSRVIKGSAISLLTLNAGGFAYQVKLEVNDTVLVFLQQATYSASDGTPVFTLLERPYLKPLLFVLRGESIQPVDQSLSPYFEHVSVTELLAEF